MNHQLMPLRDAAKALNVPYPTAFSYLKKGRVPCMTLGRYRLVTVQGLKDALERYGYKPAQHDNQK